MTTGVTVDFNANLARFTSNVDKAIADLNKFQSNAERMAGGLKSTFAALGAGLSVAAVVAWGKSTIDAADNMNDLSQRIGVGVKDLAKWKLAAEQSGTTVEALAKGVKGLGAQMIEHGDRMRAAGITATDANGALIQLSDIFAFLPDGIEKTALATQLFGKAGMELLPMLNMGSKGLKEAQEKSRQYAEELAKLAPDADKLNDALRELKMQSEASALSIMSKMTPGMQGLVEWIKDARSGAEGLANALGYIAEKSDSEIMRGLAWLAGEAGTTRSRGYQGPKNAVGLPATEAEMFDQATTDFVAGGGIADAYKRKEAAARARKLLIKPTEKNGKLDSMLERGQQNLYASLDSEEEARILAQKRVIEDTKKEFEDLQRMLKRGEENELALYYETAGEETQRLVAEQRTLKDAIKENTGMAHDLGFTFASAAEDAILKWESVGDVLRGLGQDVARIFLRSTITEPLGNSLAGAFKGMGGGSGLLSGIKNMFTFDGGGYTGAGSRSGGLDGKGGFMAVLHPNETVVDHNKGGISGGVTIIQNINIDSRSDQGTIAAAMVQAKNAAVAEVHNAMRRGAWA